jgi:hypothetical protein
MGTTMKKIITVFFCLFLLFSASTSAQGNNIVGNWLGKLMVSGISLRIEIQISKDSAANYKAFLKSPDQVADMTFPAELVTFINDSIKIGFDALKGFYSGKVKSDTSIDGTWSQGGKDFSLPLSRVEKLVEIIRPQNPRKPYPYKEEEVNVINKEAGVTLAGTFTHPEIGNNFPAVILITGSGAQNRDEELLGHKPFLILSDYLTRQGIAVLRCDDRGFGKSTGNFSSATTKDFATDILACVEYLKTRSDVDKKHIGLIGHSEGGLIAPMVAVKSKDVSFIVMMAGPGICGEKILELQSKLIAKAGGETDEKINKSVTLSKKLYKIVKEEKDSSVAAVKLKKVMDEFYNSMSEDEKKLPGNSHENLTGQVRELLTPWFKFFLSFDPKDNLSKLRIPILALNGEKDLQVPPKENLAAIEAALKKAGNKDFMIMEFPNLNHLFQTSETGAPSEYNKIEETMAPVALFTISEWILKESKN